MSPTDSQSGRVLVKVCGLTRPEDAVVAAEAGADRLGVIFAGGSKRRVTVDQARAIVAAVRDAARSAGREPPVVVGVFRNGSIDEVAGTVRSAGLGGVQFHGDEPPALVRHAFALLLQQANPAGRSPLLMRAFGIAGGASVADVESWCRDFRSADGRATASSPPLGVLLDGPGGGTGVALDWGLLAAEGERLRRAATPGQVWLAGGLHPGNVAEAVRTVRPDGVDASSGLETSPGIKDPARIRAFVAAVRDAGAAVPRAR